MLTSYYLIGYREGNPFNNPYNRYLSTGFSSAVAARGDSSLRPELVLSPPPTSPRGSSSTARKTLFSSGGSSSSSSSSSRHKPTTKAPSPDDPPPPALVEVDDSDDDDEPDDDPERANAAARYAGLLATQLLEDAKTLAEKTLADAKNLAAQTLAEQSRTAALTLAAAQTPTPPHQQSQRTKKSKNFIISIFFAPVLSTSCCRFSFHFPTA